MDTQPTTSGRALEAQEICDYLNELAQEIFLPGDGHLSDEARAFLDRASIRRDDRHARRDAERIIQSIAQQIYNRRHSDAPASELAYGEWIASLQPGDKIGVGASWWSEPDEDMSVFFVRLDEATQQILTISEWPLDPEDEGLLRQWSAYTLVDAYDPDFKLFP